MSGQRIVDGGGRIVVVGSRVLYGAPETPEEVVAATGVVTSISDFEVDYNDEIGGAQMFPPVVTIRFADGDEDKAATYDVTPIGWSSYPDGPEEHVFEADDVVVLDRWVTFFPWGDHTPSGGFVTYGPFDSEEKARAHARTLTTDPGEGQIAKLEPVGS